MGSSRRRWLNPSTPLRVASSTASQVFQVLRWITSPCPGHMHVGKVTSVHGVNDRRDVRSRHP